MILSSGSPSGSITIAMPSSSRSNTPGAQNEQFPDPMQTSRLISIDNATNHRQPRRRHPNRPPPTTTAGPYPPSRFGIRSDRLGQLGGDRLELGQRRRRPGAARVGEV